MRRRRVSVRLLSALVLPACAVAGWNDDVPATAKWVVHLDVTALMASPLGSAITQRLQTPAVAEKVNWMKAACDLDPAHDVTSATLYGTDFERSNGVMVARGRFNQARLLALLDQNATHASVAHGTTLVHTWTDARSGRPMAGAFHGDAILILASSADRLRASLDVLDKAQPAMAAASLSAADAGTFVQIEAEANQGTIGDHPKARVLQNADHVAILLGGQGADATICATVMAVSEAAAQQIEQVMRGMQAFMALSAEQNPDAAAVANAAQITRQGRSVQLSLSYEAEELLTALRSCRPHYGGNHSKDQ